MCTNRYIKTVKYLLKNLVKSIDILLNNINII